MGVVVISGALANKPGNGGGAWERMSWVVGLRRLGLDVYFVEQIAPHACADADGRPAPFHDSANLAWFRAITQWFDVADRAALVCGNAETCAGVPWPRLLEIAEA